ncbi:GFA family protein [Shewanella cyperi]|uniref:GFA family protein n=1 Tax=Shewanella cyperi TaxID=2814292 RepID=UPI001A93D4C8|nr:GFA family protein [Shewanella cyperi]QSX40085.1 GFA family protein [Shewanella cyperi]
MKYRGSCHCQAVQFEVECPDTVEVEDCNCSICSKAGFLHLIVPLSQFTLLRGADKLTTYSFNSHVAKHTFCRICGIKPFYTPRSNPDGIDINLRCLDEKPANIRIVKFDGQNWEQHAHALAHKSQASQKPD